MDSCRSRNVRCSSLVVYSSGVTAQGSGRYQAYFVTAPSCPQCQAMLPDIVRTPWVRVWDWSRSSSRTSYQRLRAGYGLPRQENPVVLPLLVTTGPGSQYRERTGPRDIASGLARIGKWNSPRFPHVQVAAVVLGFALGYGFGPVVYASCRLLLGVGAVMAAMKLSVACVACDASRTVALTGAAIGACSIGALVVGNGRPTTPRVAALALLVAGLLAGQFFLLIEDARLCLPCTGFLLIASLLGGAVPASDSGAVECHSKPAGALPVGLLMAASALVWGSHAIAAE